MGVISLREYAAKKSISYEAVRQQVSRYRTELGDHIIKNGRQQYLDDEAVAFLDERRQSNPIVIYQANKDEEIENLRSKNQGLLEQLVAAQTIIIEQKEKLGELADPAQKIFLLEAASKSADERARAAEDRATLAEEYRDRAKDEAIKMKRERDTEKERAQTAEDVAELNAQEAARAKAEAEDLRAQLDRLATSRGLKRRNLLKQLKTEGKI